MTQLQKLTLRLSEIRQKLNDISALSDEDFTEEKRSEYDNLKTELSNVETRYQAAVLAEPEPEQTEKLLADTTGEGAEVRKLFNEAKPESYFRCAFRSMDISGAEQELNDALKVDLPQTQGGVIMPLEMFVDNPLEQRASPLEMRAPTTTSALEGQEMYQNIMQKLYASPVTEALSISMHSVPSGQPVFILLTDGGTAPAQVAENANIAAATAATFSTKKMEPVRLGVQYEYTAEVAAQIPQIVSSLRENIMLEMRDKMQNQIINGDGTSPNVEGFMNRVAAQADDPDSTTTFAAMLNSLSSVVNGVVCSEEGAVSLLAGIETYKHCCGLYNVGSGESASEALKRRGRSFMASSYLPAAASNLQKSNLLHAGGNRSDDSVLCLWPAIELLVDRVTKARASVTVLTAVQLWNFTAAWRPNAYARFTTKLG